MKSHIEDYGHIVTKLEAKDIAKLIATFYFETDKEFETIFDAIIKEFRQFDVGTRQDCIEKMLRAHLIKGVADRFISELYLLNEGGPWK